MKYTAVRKVLIIAVSILMVAPLSCTAGKKKESKAAVAVADKEIRWMSLDDVQVAMKKQPRKIWFDVYTGWCGWCKVMDKKTYTNPEVIKYINANFYAVKFDAETKDTIRFMGKMFGFVPERGVNQFAIEIMRGQLSYPTSVYMDGMEIIPVPGYQTVPNLEMILKYLVDGNYKKTPFDQWQKEFKASWAEVDPAPEVAPGH